MNLKELSNVVKDCIQICIDDNVKIEDVDIYIGDGTDAFSVNKAQFRFSSIVFNNRILVLEHDD